MSGNNIRIGTCSWTEKSLIESGVFYPAGMKSAEERLKHYALHFDTVEVDSSYYGIPVATTAEQWAERTPQGFLFHVKAYAALTGHNVNPKTIAKELRERLPAGEREKDTVRIEDRAFLGDLARALAVSLAPLQKEGKLGFIIFQFPPWFGYSSANLDYLLSCREMLPGMPIAVEFRHGSWLSTRRTAEVVGFLRANKITYITADEPQYGTLATVPYLPEATTSIAYLRLHGRNKESWVGKGVPRYDYRYSDEELSFFCSSAQELSAKARTVFVMFNNCHVGYAIINALRMKEMLLRGRGTASGRP